MSNLIGSCMDLHHCSFWQIKAEDGGDPPLWSTVKLHIEWIRKPVPSPLPLSFTQRYYNFSISETAGVAQPVGVVAISQSTTPVWFNIVGKRKKKCRSKSYICIVFIIVALIIEMFPTKQRAKQRPMIIFYV